MELVRGSPVTDYCDARRLTIPRRLELFMAVCHAVQHAAALEASGELPAIEDSDLGPDAEEWMVAQIALREARAATR